MLNFKKPYNLKIAGIVISGVLLFTEGVYSGDSLRLPVGGNDTLARTIEILRQQETGSSEQKIFNYLLAEPYIMHDIAVKEQVNLGDKELVGAYGCSGGDIYNAFKSTNASTIYLIDETEVDMENLKYYWKERWSSLEYDDYSYDIRSGTISEYNSFKYKNGYAKVGSIKDSSTMALAVARELKALGVAKKDLIDIKKDEDGNLNIVFKWKYNKYSPERIRTAIFIKADITKIPRELNEKFRGKLDFYYQRAAMSETSSVPAKYPEFITIISEWIREGGFMITDDQNADDEDFGPILEDILKDFVLIGTTDNMNLWAQEIIAYQHAVFGRKNLYGWSVNIRQKIGDNVDVYPNKALPVCL